MSVIQPINIYFCGSIKGGRQLVDVYKHIIDYCKQYGDVLTEHVGDINYISGDYIHASEVYNQDTQWLRDSDIVIAEISTPSLGVGYELAYAQNIHKPVYCLYNRQLSPSVSYMIIGCEHFKCYEYADYTELDSILHKIFTKE
ncbi:MAG: nucleoside 2-deoxyribosyltransferase [Clostridia bacterium]|nr:nucleoside 2-deoxyribosyltransferase [Clostridia bacterium]